MNILLKTQTELDIENIEHATETFINSLNAAIFTLNLCYDALWKLPDDRLVNVLQKLYDLGKLQELFEDHYISATSLNLIQEKAGYSGQSAYAVAGKEFQIIDGVVSLVYPPTPEVVVEPIPNEIINPEIPVNPEIIPEP